MSRLSQWGESGPVSASILLNDTESVWVVQKGGVDLFAVALESGRAAGPREHLCRLRAGQMIIGLLDATAPAMTGLLAVPLPGTALEKRASRRSRFLAGPAPMDAAADHELEAMDAALVAVSVSEWIEALTSTVAPPPPRDYVAARLGPPLFLSVGDQLYAQGATVWVDTLSAQLLAPLSRQSTCGQSLLALTGHLSALVQTGGEAQCLSTLEVFGAGRLDSALSAFHDELLGYLGARREHNECGMSDRLAKTASTDAHAVTSTLAGLLRLLSSEAPHSRADPESPSVLVDALEHVLRASGIMAKLDRKLDLAADVPPLEQYMRQLRVSSRAVALTRQDWWREDAGPLLAFRDDGGTPVALLPATDHGYWLVDPLNASRERLNPLEAATLRTTAFMFYRSFPDTAMALPGLMKFALAGTGADIRAVVVAGTLGGALGVLVPVATGLLIDDVIPNGQRGDLWYLVLLLIATAIGIGSFELTRAIAMLRVEAKLGLATESAMMYRLLHLPARFFREYSAGDLALRAASASLIVRTISNNTQSAVFGWVFGLFSYAYLFMLSARLALVATLLTATALAVSGAVNLWRINIERRRFQIQGVIASRLFQFVNGIAKIRSGGAESRAFSIWGRLFEAQKSLDLRSRRADNGLMVFDAGFTVLTTLTLFGIISATQHTMSTGDFLAFTAAFAQFFAATVAMTSALTASLTVVPLFERAEPILSTLPEFAGAGMPPGALSGSIDISQLSFRYSPEGPLALDGLSLRIRAGEMVAFVGPSGSGKSTLLRLLLGFERPSQGSIYYDGQDLARLDVTAVRRQFGVVMQNGKLLPGDIHTNIVGASSLTIDDAWEAARMSGLEDDIRAMPMGMQTMISDGASTLSGGQRQRLMIARAIVNKPRILLFDEATSALDNSTQTLVARSIENLNATRVVIAHRLSTVIKAHRIFVMDGGRVVECGSYGDLLAKGGLFTTLARRQIV